jgi:hypothetical protein
MKLIKELNEAAKSSESDRACAKYFDVSRFDDFVDAIKELMDSGMSYEDAKAEAFDETEVPEMDSPCCKQLYAAVTHRD